MSNIRFHDQFRTFMRSEIPDGAETQANILATMLEEEILLTTEDDVTGAMMIEQRHSVDTNE